MNFNLIKPLLFAIILLFCFSANAQQTPAGSGSVTGKLIDGANGQPLGFASVALIRKADSKQISGMQTDIDGNFKFANLADGRYMLRASYVNYNTFTRDTINIRPAKRIYTLSLTLRPSKKELKEVTVSAQRSEIKLDIDKKSFNVGESLVSEGGSATDLLANVPSVQVDVDGNVSLRGSSSVKVLINGKPSTLTGGNLTDILQSIPASAIETIEVITNPSSKYDAEGQSGIINIVLKRNAQLGLSGSASLTRGTQNTTNANVGLAYKSKKINIYGNYSYRKSDRISNGFVNKNVDSANVVNQHTNQISNQTFTYGGSNIRTGIDFYLTPKSTLSFSDNINIRSSHHTQTGTSTITRNDTLFQVQNTNNYSTGTGTNVDLNLDFEQKFAKKQELLTANIGYSDDRSHNFDYLNTGITNYTMPNTPPSLTNDDKEGRARSINVQSDFTLPLTNGRFETGFRVNYNRSDNNYVSDTLNWATNVFVYSPILSNDFIYKQDVNAVYADYQHSFGNFGVQGGLRGEDTHINTQLTSAGVVTLNSQDYFRLYPSLFLTQKLSESQTLQLSYSRRVARPSDRQLSPFLDVSNKQNYQQGNPDLVPEDTHAMELSYINYFKSIILTSSLYYRLTHNIIQQIVTPLTPTDLSTTLSVFENIKSASNAGYELIAKITPSPVFDFTANLNAYYHHISADPTYNILSSSGYSWNGNLTASIKPTQKLRFQIRGDYQGKQVTPQGYSLARYGVDGGVRYSVTKQLNLSLNSRDIFNTRKYVSETNTNNGILITDQTSQRRFATRAILFTISYHFGKTPQQIFQDEKDKEKLRNDKDNKDNNKNTPNDQDDQEDDATPNKNGTPASGTVTPPGNGPANGVPPVNNQGAVQQQ